MACNMYVFIFCLKDTVWTTKIFNIYIEYMRYRYGVQY